MRSNPHQQTIDMSQSDIDPLWRAKQSFTYNNPLVKNERQVNYNDHHLTNQKSDEPSSKQFNPFMFDLDCELDKINNVNESIQPSIMENENDEFDELNFDNRFIRNNNFIQERNQTLYKKSQNNYTTKPNQIGNLDIIHESITDTNCLFESPYSQEFNQRKRQQELFGNTLQNENLIKNDSNYYGNQIKEEGCNNDYSSGTLSLNKSTISRMGRIRSKYRMLDPDTKRKAIELARHQSLKVASATFNAPIKSLKRWMKVGPLRKKGGGRKTKDPEMERELYQWYLETKKQNIAITARMIKNKAIEFSKCQDFIASKGWLDKFKFRYKLEIEKEGNRNNSTFSYNTSEKEGDSGGDNMDEMSDEEDDESDLMSDDEEQTLSEDLQQKQQNHSMIQIPLKYENGHYPQSIETNNIKQIQSFRNQRANGYQQVFRIQQFDKYTRDQILEIKQHQNYMGHNSNHLNSSQGQYQNNNSVEDKKQWPSLLNFSDTNNDEDVILSDSYEEEFE